MFVNELVIARPRSLTASSRMMGTTPGRLPMAPAALQVITMWRTCSGYRCCANCSRATPSELSPDREKDTRRHSAPGNYVIVEVGQQLCAGNTPDRAPPLLSAAARRALSRCNRSCPRRPESLGKRPMQEEDRTPRSRSQSQSGLTEGTQRFSATFPAADEFPAACRPAPTPYAPAPAMRRAASVRPGLPPEWHSSHFTAQRISSAPALWLLVCLEFGGDDGARTRDLCRDSTEASSNLLKLSVTDGFFWRSEVPLATLIGPLSDPRPLPYKPLPFSALTRDLGLSGLAPGSVRHRAPWLSRLPKLESLFKANKKRI